MVGRRKLGLVTWCIRRGLVQSPVSAMQSPPNRRPPFWSAGHDRDHSRPQMSLCGRGGGWLETEKGNPTTVRRRRSIILIIASHRVCVWAIPPRGCTGTDRHSTAACRPRFVLLNKDAASPQQHPDLVHCGDTTAHMHHSNTHPPTRSKTVGAAANRALAATHSRGTRLGYRFHR